MSTIENPVATSKKSGYASALFIDSRSVCASVRNAAVSAKI